MDPYAATRTRTKLLIVKQTPNTHARAWLMILALAWAAFAPTPVAGSDEPPVLPEWARQADIPLDELEIRLVPLRLDELELIKADTMAEVRACSAELAEVMIARTQLSRGVMRTSSRSRPSQSGQSACSFGRRPWSAARTRSSMPSRRRAATLRRSERTSPPSPTCVPIWGRRSRREKPRTSRLTKSR
jgi:hypothetical protein